MMTMARFTNRDPKGDQYLVTGVAKKPATLRLGTRPGPFAGEP
jgi:hypothetical protein